MLSLNGSNDSNGDGRDRTNKDDTMDDLVVDLLATLEGLVDQHGLSIQEDESCQHQDSVEVELLSPMIRPREPFLVLNNPVNKKDDRSEEKKLGKTVKDSKETT